jgi:hypothetical protein
MTDRHVKIWHTNKRRRDVDIIPTDVLLNICTENCVEEHLSKETGKPNCSFSIFTLAAYVA